MPNWEIAIFFAIIAFIYASVGFGGGSSYLAILAVYALPFQEIRLIALVCNIIVVTGGTFHFIRNKKVNWHKILPLVCTSIPMAFLGAKMRLSQDVFFIILGCSLLLAASLLWIKTKQLIFCASLRKGTRALFSSLVEKLLVKRHNNGCKIWNPTTVYQVIFFYVFANNPKINCRGNKADKKQ